MQNNYHFLQKLIIRTPKDSLTVALSQEEVEIKLKNTSYLESLYLASPSLYASVLAFNRGELSAKQKRKVLFANARYLLRSKSRATPFGLFSGVGILNWGKESKVVLADNMVRKTRIDLQYFSLLIEALNAHPEVGKHLKYHANESHYRFGDQIRYIEQLQENGKLAFQISSVESNEPIEAVLKASKQGVTIDSLSGMLVSDDISQSEAEEFILGLIDCQLLRSEFEPALTGGELISQTIAKLSFIKSDFSSSIIAKLKEIQSELSSLDEKEVNEVSKYFEIAKLVSSVGIELDEDKLFTVDAKLKTIEGSSIDDAIQKELLTAIVKLAKLEQKDEPQGLTEFKKRFVNRFGKEEVPLLEALDTELGLGYGINVEVSSELISDLVLPERSKEELKHSEISKKLFSALQRATRNGAYEVSFENLELTERETEVNLAPTSSVVFSHINDDMIHLNGVGGSSALNMLSRFGSSSDDIRTLLNEITEKESEDNPEVLFAEILHLPDTKIGNILMRPASRKYEIPVLSKATVTSDEQVSLPDLYISVSDDKVLLRDKKKNKIIIPRLSTALDYTKSSLPVFMFLCDLQYQGFQKKLKFDWGSLKGSFTFLPRVSEGRVIVHLATWQLSGAILNNAQRLNSITAFQEWRKSLKIPVRFVISEGDNNLLINSENPFLVDLFLETIKNKKKVTLKEFLLGQSAIVKNESGEQMVHELVAVLRRKEAIYASQGIALQEEKSKKVNFPEPILEDNSDWVYFKIYCSPRSADAILQNGIYGLIKRAKARKLIKKWFFIRYYDPDFHLRIRFEVSNKNEVQAFLDLFNISLSPLVGVLWQIKTEIYEPETSRYGELGMEPSETIFQLDSEAVLNYLAIKEEADSEEGKWLFSLRAVDEWLDNVGYSLAEKKGFVEQLKDKFAEEFKMDLSLKRQLDKKYRTYRKEINYYLNKEDLETERILNLRGKSNRTDKMGIKISASFIHMHVNRLMSSRPRLYEFIIYEFLSRCYTSKIARLKR